MLVVSETSTSYTIVIPRYLKVMEAAELLHVTPQFIYKAVRLNQLPATRIGKAIRIDPHHLFAWAQPLTREDAAKLPVTPTPDAIAEDSEFAPRPTTPAELLEPFNDRHVDAVLESTPPTPATELPDGTSWFQRRTLKIGQGV